MKQLTNKQKKVLDSIKAFIKEKNFPPTCEELRNILGYKSANNVYLYLNAIEKKGYIERTPKIARSIVVLQA